MRIKMYCVIVLSCLLGRLPSYATAPVDSVGIERNLGELFVLHEVSEGETLFAIAQRYGVPMNDLKKINRSINFRKLSIGDTLRIPMFPELTKGKKTPHTVAEGETLFSLSRKYRVEVNDIRRWNALGDAAIAIGQQLIVYLDAPSETTTLDTTQYVVHTVDEGETLYAISRAYDVDVNELRQRNKLPNESLQFGQSLIIREKEILPRASLANPASSRKISDRLAPPPSVASNDAAALLTNAPPPRQRLRTEALAVERERFQEIKKQEERALEDIEVVSELGFASVIEGGSATKKYLALHRTAPVGTVLRVRNEMNEVSIFVRIVGKLPDTGVNDKITIRLTPAAYQKLGGINERFPVEISYLE